MNYCIQDEATGWTEDLLIPRQSALNLLAIIAMAKVGILLVNYIRSYDRRLVLVN